MQLAVLELVLSQECCRAMQWQWVRPRSARCACGVSGHRPGCVGALAWRMLLSWPQSAPS